jgi:hypothetical protein
MGQRIQYLQKSHYGTRAPGAITIHADLGWLIRASQCNLLCLSRERLGALGLRH